MSVKSVPTVELVSVTAEAVSLTVAEPAVFTVSVGADTLLAAIVPEPESIVSVLPLEMLLPVAVWVILPEPLAFSVTAPVPDSVPVTVMLPLLRVLMSLVPVVTLPETVVSVPEVVVKLPALTVPPKVHRRAGGHARRCRNRQAAGCFKRRTCISCEAAAPIPFRPGSYPLQRSGSLHWSR